MPVIMEGEEPLELPLPIRDSSNNPILNVRLLEKKKSVRDVSFVGKKALVRVDYNCPTDDTKIVDDTRIRESIPTIEYLLHAGCACVVLIAHFGRPAGNFNRSKVLS